MYVVTPRDWIPLAVIGGLLVLLGVWSVTGAIPTALTGRTVLIQPRKLLEVQASASGRLETLGLVAGASIKGGAVVGTMDQAEILKQLREDRATLSELRSQNLLRTSMEERRADVEKQEIESTRRFLQLQAQTLRKTLSDTESVKPMLQKHLDAYRKLQEEGLVADSSNELLSARQGIVENDARIADIGTRIDQTDSQLKQLDTREANIARDNVDTTMARANAIRDLEARISVNETLLRRSGEIRSPRSGKIVEVVVTSGQVVSAGARIATIELDDSDATLRSVSFFSVGDGKQIKPGMPVQITPDSIERQRFGGITGQVESVSPLPVTKAATDLLVGNPEVVQALLAGGPYIQVVSRMDRDAATSSGYKWSSSAGPQIQISSGMTGSTRVTVEGRAPVTYVFPFLRSASGIF
jgi:HlyD family secretion protein